MLIKQIPNNTPILELNIANTNVEFHFNNYGIWSTIAESVKVDAVFYSEGLGSDVSFGQSIISKYNCKVLGRDSKPGADDFIRKPNLIDFQYVKTNLAEITDLAMFFLPDNPESISHSFQSENICAFILVVVYNWIDLIKLHD